MNDRRLPEPIATMIREHETLLVLLDDLSNGVAAEGVPDTGELVQLVSSFLHCLEAHVEKEETLLFPCLRVVLGNDAEALEIFEVEHAAVGNLLSQFSDWAKRLIENKTCDPKDIRQLAELTSQACKVMPPHIFKEDNVLYPLASQMISREKLSELAVAAGIGSQAE